MLHVAPPCRSIPLRVHSQSFNQTTDGQERAAPPCHNPSTHHRSGVRRAENNIRPRKGGGGGREHSVGGAERLYRRICVWVGVWVGGWV